jgi:probable F420-dependent oxidoreductase
MRIGFSLPLHGKAARPEGILTIARRAEALGFESLWVWERLLSPLAPKAPYPLGGALPEAFRSVLDPLEVLTFVAGHTERVTLGTSVLILPWHNPALLGRRLATIDQLSRGRLRLGFGVGWLPDEFDAVGVPWAERGKRADEALRVLKAIWTTDPVEFSGTYYHIPRSYMGPKPLQKPHPPLYLGAYTPPAMRRLAREANGWTPVGIPLSGIPQILETLKAMAREERRRPETLEVVVRANLQPSEKPLGRDRPDFHGTLEQIGEDVARAREAGATELFFDLWPAHPAVDSTEDWLGWMERLREIT